MTLREREWAWVGAHAVLIAWALLAGALVGALVSDVVIVAISLVVAILNGVGLWLTMRRVRKGWE